MSPETPKSSSSQPPAWRGWAFFVAALGGAVLLAILGASILERRGEAKRQLPLEPIAQFETDAGKWAANYPREYDRYKLMENSETHTKYGGSFPRDYLEETPANVILFAGYGFAKEYRQARGHVHAIEDVSSTKRLKSDTPATCWTCKSPDVPRLMAEMGPQKFYAHTFNELKEEVKHPIGCLDCHEPNTMKLRVSRPALREAFEAQGKDIDQASHQEMRTLVCAQCHVEYYFKKKGDYLTFPWAKGTQIEQIEEYYEDRAKKDEFTADWTHAISKAPMLKMQHPDYEIYSTGIHAYRGVSCADCHMPYRTEGGVKFTDHYIQSPLLNIANSCAVCHRWSEGEIRQRVESIQDKVREGRVRAEDAVSKAHLDIAAAMQAGAKDEELKEVRQLVRRAQMRWDFVAANNGMGFHSPQECLRILNAAVDLAGQCRIECARILAKHGVTEPVNYPDYGTKDSASKILQDFLSGKPPQLIVKAGASSK